MALVKQDSVILDEKYDYGKYLAEQPPERFVCKICLKLSRGPMLSNCCGYTFCCECIETAKGCPVCDDMSFQTIRNKQAEREIPYLSVVCRNKGEGCQWQGLVKDLAKHLENKDGCVFVELRCPNGCGKLLQRRYLYSHNETDCPKKQFICQYCDERGEESFINGQHLQECLHYPVECPNKCDTPKLTRKDLDNHRKKVCPNEMSKCEYYDVGCHVELTRKEMESHCKQKVATHLALTRQELLKASEKLKKTEDILTAEIKATTESYESTLKELNSATRRLTKTQEEVESTKVLLGKAESEISQGLGYVESVTQIRVNELEKKLRGELNAQLEKIFTTTDWNMKVAWQVTSTKENQVTPVWIRMPDYTNLKKQSNSWHSPPFYTYSGGYRMCLCVYAAGDDGGMGTHMSVYACVMKGAYDDSLGWPLQGNLEVIILNQNSNTDHFGKTIRYTGDTTTETGNRVITGELGKARGYPLFISNKDLKSRHCVKHNSVCFQISFNRH